MFAIVLAFLRLLLAVALVAVVSGLPRVAHAVLVDDCCAEPCDGGADGEQCPPSCTNGTCAKAFPTAVPPRAGEQAAAAADPAQHRISTAAPALPLVPSGVFHPPRR
jgi:hypothetical protein